MAEAVDNEVSVCRTAKDLVLGSVFDSSGCGTYDLMGGQVSEIYMPFRPERATLRVTRS